MYNSFRFNRKHQPLKTLAKLEFHGDEKRHAFNLKPALTESPCMLDGLNVAQHGVSNVARALR
jgi:hypothetical protein